jgi:hypothetical protein
MPEKPLAIQLNSLTVGRIINTLDIYRKDDLDVLEEALQSEETYYYVKGAYFGSGRMPFLIYNERDFLTDYAQAAPSITSQFVPVLPIRIGP